MLLRMIYDDHLAQAAYLLACQRTREAIVIDAPRDVDRVLDLARREGVRLTLAAETHIHADFLAGTRELAERCGARVCLSDMGDADWKYDWQQRKTGGGAYDHQMLHHDDVIRVGQIELRVLHTPGHTPEHIAFLVTDRGAGAGEPMGIISGDWLFVGDLGRPDLLETAAGHAGSALPAAMRLHETTRRNFELPDFVQVWPGHGAGSACGKALGAVPQSTIGYERRFNTTARAALELSAPEFASAILTDQPEPPTYFARMKRENKLGPAVLGALPRPRELMPDDLRGLPAAAIVIDMRPWQHYLAGHVPGALSILPGAAFPTLAGCYVAPTAEIVLICEPAQVDAAVRDLVHVGLDRCVAWAQPEALSTAARGGLTLRTTPELDIAAASERRDAGDYWLDVRSAAEFARGHVPGAANIAHTRLAARLGDLPRDRRIVVNCQGGTRSARACSFLEQHGFSVANVAGGFNAWRAAGKPVDA